MTGSMAQSATSFGLLFRECIMWNVKQPQIKKNYLPKKELQLPTLFWKPVE